jgi:hypothetical protein
MFANGLHSGNGLTKSEKSPGMRENSQNVGDTGLGKTTGQISVTAESGIVLVLRFWYSIGSGIYKAFDGKGKSKALGQGGAEPLSCARLSPL